jgi:hypothetical protein
MIAVVVALPWLFAQMISSVQAGAPANGLNVDIYNYSSSEGTYDPSTYQLTALSKNSDWSHSLLVRLSDIIQFEF